MSVDYPPLEGQVAALFEALPDDGSGKGNSALRRELGWDEQQYLAVRNELLDLGAAERWKGRGGSLRRVVAGPAPEPEQLAEEVEREYRQERDLYRPMATAIEVGWAPENRLTPCVVAITAHQGRRTTGGRWTRPDMVLVCVRKFRFVPGARLYVVTFEVKLGPALDVTAVYEALSHRRAATDSVVLIHREGVDEGQLKAVCGEAARRGIGVVVADDPSDSETWETLVEPEASEPDPDRLDAFLASQLPRDLQDQVMAMLAP